MQKRDGEIEVERKKAAQNNQLYTGPTPMSELVRGKATDIMGEFSELLNEATSEMEWASVWHLIKPEQRADVGERA